MDSTGFEPVAFTLQTWRSTPDLRARTDCAILVPCIRIYLLLNVVFDQSPGSYEDLSKKKNPDPNFSKIYKDITRISSIKK